MIVVNKEPVKGKVLEPESEKNRIPSGKGHSFFYQVFGKEVRYEQIEYYHTQ